MVALEQRYCNRKPRCVMARPGESLKNNNAEIWRETHLSRASEGPKRTGCQGRTKSTSARRSKNTSVGGGRWVDGFASGRGSARGIAPSQLRKSNLVKRAES